MFNKTHELFDFKTSIPFNIKIMQKPHTLLLPDLWIFQQEFLNCNDIYVSWSWEKFLKLRKSKFWARQFFSTVTFKWIFDIHLLINRTYLFL